MLKGFALSLLVLGSAAGLAAAEPQAGPAPTVAPASADACDLAVAALVALKLDEGEGAVAVSDEVNDPRLDDETLAAAKGAQPGPKGPSSAMAQAYLSAKPVSAVTACPKVRAYLDSQKVGYGPEGIRQAEREAGRDPLGAMIIRLSLPVLSPDGREAIMDMSYDFRTGGGGGKTYYWREPAGGWHAGDLERWLS